MTSAACTLGDLPSFVGRSVTALRFITAPPTFCVQRAVRLVLPALLEMHEQTGHNG